MATRVTTGTSRCWCPVRWQRFASPDWTWRHPISWSGPAARARKPTARVRVGGARQLGIRAAREPLERRQRRQPRRLVGGCPHGTGEPLEPLSFRCRQPWCSGGSTRASRENHSACCFRSRARRSGRRRFSPDGRFISFVAVRLDRPGVLELGIADITGPGTDAMDNDCRRPHLGATSRAGRPTAARCISFRESPLGTTTSGVFASTRSRARRHPSRSSSATSIRRISQSTLKLVGRRSTSPPTASCSRWCRRRAASG